MKLKLVSLFGILITLPGLLDALRCYTCDNVGAGEKCITAPQTVPNGYTPCQSPNDEYCYTSRLEEEGGKITFNRGCCRVVDNSPVCPLGDKVQIIENNDPVFTKYLSRCDGDLCNDDDGTGSSGSGSGSGGIVIVEGLPPKNPKKSSSNTAATVEMSMASLILTTLLMFLK